MKLKEMITSVTELDANYLIETFYDGEQDPKRIECYVKSFNLLKGLEPIKSEMTINIGKVEPTAFNTESYYDVYGTISSDPNEKYSLLFENWQNCLGMEVQENSELTHDQMIVRILYELTFFGFENEAHKTNLTELESDSYEYDDTPVSC